MTFSQTHFMIEVWDRLGGRACDTEVVGLSFLLTDKWRQWLKSSNRWFGPCSYTQVRKWPSELQCSYFFWFSGIAVYPSVCNFLLRMQWHCNMHFCVTTIYIYKYIYPCQFFFNFAYISRWDLCFSSIITFCLFFFFLGLHLLWRNT